MFERAMARADLARLSRANNGAKQKKEAIANAVG
jgi:hypothetical protein